MQLNGKLKTVVQGMPRRPGYAGGGVPASATAGSAVLARVGRGRRALVAYSFVGLGARARLWSTAVGPGARSVPATRRCLPSRSTTHSTRSSNMPGNSAWQPDPRIPRGLGGLVGYVGYDYARRMERLARRRRALPCPS